MADLRTCKICNETKVRIESGKYPSKRNKKYIDAAGKLWSGTTCPDCHAKKQAEAIKQRRLVKKETPSA